MWVAGALNAFFVTVLLARRDILWAIREDGVAAQRGPCDERRCRLYFVRGLRCPIASSLLGGIAQIILDMARANTPR